MFLLRRVTRSFVRFFTVSISQGLAWIRDGEARFTATTADETEKQKIGGKHKNHRSQKRKPARRWMDEEPRERENRDRPSRRSLDPGKTTQAQTNFAEREREERV